MKTIRVCKEFRKVNSKLKIAKDIIKSQKVDAVVHGARRDIYMSFFENANDEEPKKTIIVTPELFAMNAKLVLQELKKMGYKIEY